MKHLTLILLLFMTCSWVQAPEDDKGYIVKVGDKAPDIELIFPNGTKKQLKDLKGKSSCCNSLPAGVVYAGRRCPL